MCGQPLDRTTTENRTRKKYEKKAHKKRKKKRRTKKQEKKGAQKKQEKKGAKKNNNNKTKTKKIYKKKTHKNSKKKKSPTFAAHGVGEPAVLVRQGSDPRRPDHQVLHVPPRQGRVGLQREGHDARCDGGGGGGSCGETSKFITSLKFIPYSKFIPQSKFIPSTKNCYLVVITKLLRDRSSWKETFL